MNIDMLKKEIKYLLKNPMFFLGMVVVVYILVSTLSPYFGLYKNTTDTVQKNKYGEYDLIDGYIPTPEKEKREQALQKIHTSLIEDYHVSSEEAQSALQELKKMDTQEEIKKYLSENYAISGGGVDSIFSSLLCKKATKNQMKDYLQSAFSEEPYAESLSYKYIDYMGIGLVYFSIIVFMFIFMRDMKKDIYSLVHTKPILPCSYLVTKLVSGLIPIYIFAIALTGIFDIIANRFAVTNGFSCEWFSVWAKLFLLVLPNVFMIGVFFIFITMLFKNILPTIPALLVYATYSNMGRSSEDGFMYTPNPLAIIVRFPNDLTYNYLPVGTIINQIALVALAVCLLFVSIRLWERRKII